MVLLSSILNDQKKSNFISQTSLSLNYCEISEIDRLPNKYRSITKLFVSHNKLTNLDGIEQFTSLHQISLSYNSIEDWREILKIPNKEKVKYLSIQGNPLDNHPDHIKYILDHFCNIERLDDFKIDDFFRQSVEKHSKNICLNIIPFLFFLDNDQNSLLHILKTKHINQELNKNMNVSVKKIIEKFVNSSRIKWLMSFKKIRNFSEQTNLLSLLTNLSDLTTQMYDGCMDNLDIPNLRQSFYNLYKQLFYDLMITYRKQNDKNLEYFLISQSILNDNLDHTRFSEDLEYAKNCMMFELYKIKPTQAQIQGICSYDKENKQLNISKEYFKVRNYENLECDNLNNRIHNFEDQKLNWKYKQNEVINDLEMSYSDPEILKNECLMHFPIFSCNKNYLKAITDIINDKCVKVIDLFNELNQEKKERQSKFNFTRPRTVDHKKSLSKNNLKRSLVKSESNEGYETKKKENSFDNYKTKKMDKPMETKEKNKLITLSSNVFQLSKASQLAETLKKDEAILTESGYWRTENSHKTKIFKRNFIETFLKIIQKEYLMGQNDAFEEIKRKSKENRKKAGIQSMFEIFGNVPKKNRKLQIFFYKKARLSMRKGRTEEMYGKILKRRYFNLLCTNLLAKMKRYKSFKNKSLQYKAFFTLLKYAHTKALKRKSIQTKLKNFIKKKKRIYFGKLKEYIAIVKNEKEQEQKKLWLASRSKENLNFSNFSLSEDLENYINKIQLNQLKNVPSKRCNCKSYFRKCHACMNIAFESI